MSKNDNYWGIGCALIGGMWKYIGQIHVDNGYLVKAAGAFVVAVLCGMGGVIGKIIIHWFIKKARAWFDKRFKKRNPK